MRALVINKAERIARCEDEEFYPCGPFDWDTENEIRRDSIWKLRDFLTSEECGYSEDDVFVSDFCNGVRCLFIDLLSQEFFTSDLVSRLLEFVRADPNGHAVIGLVCAARENTEELGNFMISRSAIVIETPLVEVAEADQILARDWLKALDFVFTQPELVFAPISGFHFLKNENRWIQNRTPPDRKRLRPRLHRRPEPIRRVIREKHSPAVGELGHPSVRLREVIVVEDKDQR